jgi:hypothetical protein
MQRKQKRVLKSKEELLSDLQKNAQFIEKIKFIREVFLPTVEKGCKNVEDAKMFLSSIGTVIMERFLQQMKEKKLSDLNLIQGLDDKSPDYEGYKAILELFNDKSVFEAKELIEGMRSEIDLWITEEMRSRTLESLPKRWIDQI